MRREPVRTSLVSAPERPEASDIFVAFWEPPPSARALFAVCSGATLVMLSLTALGAVGLFDKN